MNRQFSICLAFVALYACSSEDTHEEPRPDAGDVAEDAGEATVDAAADAGPDSAGETGPDAPTDVGTDTTVDSGRDAEPGDAGDAPADAPSDAADTGRADDAPSDADRCDGPDTPEGVHAALASARPGDVVLYCGPEPLRDIRLPAGVTLDANGAEIHASGGDPVGGSAVEVVGEAIDVETRLTNATVIVDEPGATSGVLAIGAGPVTIDHCNFVVSAAGAGGAVVAANTAGALTVTFTEIQTARGFGIIAESPERVVLEAVDIEGPVTDEIAAELRQWNGAETAVAGIVVGGTGDTEIDFATVNVSDFAGFGVALSEVSGHWTSGTVSGCLGAGVAIDDSSDGVELSDLAVVGARSGHRDAPEWSVGLLIESTDLTTTRLSIDGGDGFGVFQERATSTHDGLLVTGNDGPGVWAQHRSDGGGTQFALDRGIIRGNAGVGVGLFELGDGLGDGDASILRAVIADTRLAFDPRRGSPRFGDGVQVAGDSGTLAGVGESLFFGNARAAVLVGQGEGVGTSGRLEVCGHNAVSDDWGCTSEPAGPDGEYGYVECTRDGGPAAGDGWECFHGRVPDCGFEVCPSAIVCENPAAEAESPDITVASAGRPADFCAPGFDAVLEEFADLLAGAPDELFGDALAAITEVGESHYEWSCATTDSGGSVCNVPTRTIDGRSLDNPSTEDGPGWGCSNERSGTRHCRFEALGLARHLGGTIPSPDDGDPLFVYGSVADRDLAASTSGGLSAAYEVQIVVPELVSPSGLVGPVAVVGENGMALDDGRIGPRAVVGENGMSFRGTTP